MTNYSSFFDTGWRAKKNDHARWHNRPDIQNISAQGNRWPIHPKVSVNTKLKLKKFSGNISPLRKTVKSLFDRNLRYMASQIDYFEQQAKTWKWCWAVRRDTKAVLVGEMVVRRIIPKMSASDIFRNPLIGSGFWFRFRLFGRLTGLAWRLVVVLLRGSVTITIIGRITAGGIRALWSSWPGGETTRSTRESNGSKSQGDECDDWQN